MQLDPTLCRQAMLARDARFDGRFFTCVKTTGIYCRPICPARPPHAENCLFMPSAAACQAAGFRPCLRCRPEAAPGLGAWQGTSNTVARALTLIDAGALDEAGVDKLAGRLGVGERQLRRLFLRHLGATPIAVAQTRRALLARQLLHETDLPVAEVALASGFGSVRRFNEVCKAAFDQPAATLRRRAQAAAAGGSAITLSLSYRPPYDWDAMLAFLAGRATAGVKMVADGYYQRSIALSGLVGSVQVAHDAARCRLLATIWFPRTGALPAIIARLRRVFDLDADPGVIGAALSRDPRLAALVAARPGLRVPGAWDGFELAVRAILGQQISVAAATRLAGAIAQRWGAPFSQDGAPGGLTHAFPTPDALAHADIRGMPGSRAAAITTLARAAAADPALFDRGPDLDASIAKLCALPGIGDWTAQYIAMRAMREPDAFPASDIGLRQAMRTESGRPDEAALRRASEPWRPWRAYAALHLWHALPDTRKEASHALAA